MIRSIRRRPAIAMRSLQCLALWQATGISGFKIWRFLFAVTAFTELNDEPASCAAAGTGRGRLCEHPEDGVKHSGHAVGEGALWVRLPGVRHPGPDCGWAVR